MLFILEQLMYIILLFIFNPFKFFFILKNIETLPFGREVKKVIIKNEKIYKYYRNRQVYQKNVNYYYLLNKFNFIPQNINYVDSEYLIIQQYRGRLLRKSDFNEDIKKQFNNMISELCSNNIIVHDIKPLFANNNVINNITLFNNKIYLIDYGDIIISKNAEKFYDNYLEKYILY